MAKQLKEEPVATDSEGKPILGFIIKKNEFDAFKKEFDLVVKGQPYAMATREEGDNLKIKIWGMTLSVKQASQVVKELEDLSQIKGFASFDLEPKGISFGIPSRHKK